MSEAQERWFRGVVCGVPDATANYVIAPVPQRRGWDSVGMDGGPRGRPHQILISLSTYPTKLLLAGILQSNPLVLTTL